MEWWMYPVLLAVALDLDDREQEWRFLLAGGKKSDWPKRRPEEARPIRRSFWDKVKAKMGKATIGGDVGMIAQKDWKGVKRVVETMSDGSQRTRFEDGEGNDVTEQIAQLERQGYHFFRSKQR